MTVLIRKSLWTCCLIALLAPIARAADAPAPASQPALKPTATDAKREPGLVAEYFKGIRQQLKPFSAPTSQPFLLRVDKNVNFKSVNGQFYKTKLATDFVVNWSG